MAIRSAAVARPMLRFSRPDGSALCSALKRICFGKGRVPLIGSLACLSKTRILPHLPIDQFCSNECSFIVDGQRRSCQPIFTLGRVSAKPGDAEPDQRALGLEDTDRPLPAAWPRTG